MKRTSDVLKLILLSGLLILLSGCSENDPPTIPPPGTGNTPPDTTQPGDFAYEIYFSQVYSGNPSDAEANPNNADKHLVAKIDATERTLDIAAHEIDSYLIANAIIAAHQRGVRVRIVGESNYADENAMQNIRAAGIPVVFDGRPESLMHNKFLVFDEHRIWTGSMNLTWNGANRNNNNSVWIDSPELAQNFIAEFEEMFLRHEFSSDSEPNVPYPALYMADGTLIETYFSPDDDRTMTVLQHAVAQADSAIRFMAFSFTQDELSRAMVARFREGLIVEGIFDEDQAEGSSEYAYLISQGVPVIVDKNRYFMHHKTIIIDDDTVITGSYNFSYNAATRNDENFLIIRQNRDIAAQYLAEFYRLYH